MLVIPKRDTLDNFKELNPVIRNNELIKIFMPDGTNMWKLGDGKSNFSELPYIPNNKLIINLDENYYSGIIEFDFMNNDICEGQNKIIRTNIEPNKE